MTAEVTNATFAKWAQRLKRIQEKQKRRDQLANAAEARRAAASDWSCRWTRRTELYCVPDVLDGYWELYQRCAPDLRDQLLRQYHRYLAAFTDGIGTSRDPLRVDFARMPVGVRPYLLAPFLGHRINDMHPALCFERSDLPRGVLTYVSTGGPADVAFWKRSLPTIGAWLGGHWLLKTHAIDSVTLARGTPIPPSIPFTHHILAQNALFLGVDPDSGQPVQLPFAEMTSGTFIPGASGTGKSNCQHILIQSLLANLDHFTAVYLVDGKDGVAFNRYRDAAPGKVKVLWSETDLWSLCTELVATMRARNAAQRERNVDNATGDFIALVIDELPTFTQRPSSDAKHPDNKRHAQFIDELAMLARRGRSTGLRLILTAQEPVVDQIPASVRSNCLTTIAFKLPIDAHAIAVFGQLEGLPADPRQLQRGRALLKNGMTGDIRQIQFPVIGRPG